AEEVQPAALDICGVHGGPGSSRTARGPLRVLPVALEVCDDVLSFGYGGTQLGLASLVAVDDGTAELASLGVDIIEEALALWGLGNLVCNDESGDDAECQQKNALHDCSLWIR